MEFERASAYILDRLKNELPEERTYHSLGHTMDVHKVAVSLAEEQGVNGHELLILRTAALFHDCGFIYQSLRHEEKSCSIAREALPEFDYGDADIERICALIMSTQVPQQPLDELAQILCDADLDYLGRSDFDEIGEHLFKEFVFDGVVDDRTGWDELQVNFISSHTYFTKWSKENREQHKLDNLDRVKKRLASPDKS